jgi:hypothetical protein
MSRIRLKLTQPQHNDLIEHLLPPDGFEAVAIALCGRRPTEEEHNLSIYKMLMIPYSECSIRTTTGITWSTRNITLLLEEASNKDLAICKIHSHRGQFKNFSSIDDASDTDFFASVFGWTDSSYPHCSAVMLPDGQMFGRAILSTGNFQDLHSIQVVGDDIHMWSGVAEKQVSAGLKRHAQMFGTATIQKLRQLSIAVVGCSGTGSPVVEQLARLGVGRLVLIDPDYVEEKNLNRILNAGRQDAYLKTPKVEVLAKAIARMGLDTELQVICENLSTPTSVEAVASCDVVFGCMDGTEGRHILNRLAAFYLIPYFDIGVRLESDGLGGINEACGAVHYIRPDSSTLLERKVYTMEQVTAEGLKRTDPKAYRDQVKAGYIHGVIENRPAVISINMHMATIAVNELLSRLHPYRYDNNSESAIVRVSFIQNETYREAEPAGSSIFSKKVGRGDCIPLLDMPILSK